MGNRRQYKTEYVHKVDTYESEHLKVTALNLFHLIASPPLKKSEFFILRHSLLEERERVRGVFVPNQ